VHWSFYTCSHQVSAEHGTYTRFGVQGDVSVSRYARQLEAKVEKLQEMLQREMRRSAGLPSPYAPASIAQGAPRCAEISYRTLVSLGDCGVLGKCSPSSICNDARLPVT